MKFMDMVTNLLYIVFAIVILVIGIAIANPDVLTGLVR